MGKKDNPTLKHLTALAAYFRVPPAYCFDDALTEQDVADLELVAALRDSDVRALPLRGTACFRSSSLARTRITRWRGDSSRQWATGGGSGRPPGRWCFFW
jgi:hypothetical protein